MFRYRLALLFALLFFTVIPIACYAGIVPRLSGPPLGERWFSIMMNGERVGFTHINLQETTGGYELCSYGSAKFKVMGVSRESASKEKYQIGKDLSLKSFYVEQTINGTPMKLKGEVEGTTVKAVVESAGKTRKKSLKIKNRILPPSALNFYPLMQGAVAGKKYNVQMLDVEEVKVKGIEIKVIGSEKLPEGVESVHIQNDLYPFVDNDIWLDLSGNTLKESVRDGMILTIAEDALTVKKFIVDAALAKKDPLLEFSLIRVEPPLKNPENVKKMTAIFSGFPADFPLHQDAGQTSVVLADGTVKFTITRTFAMKNGKSHDQTTLASYLKTNGNNGEIAEKAKEVAGAEQDHVKMAEKLNKWIAAEIKSAAIDNQSPIETLRKKEGNCHSHALLYVTMARAVGIPSRLVSGLAYFRNKGFLYHSWVESYLGEWVPIDPALGQMPADATHIKLVEGEETENIALVGSIIGRLKGRIVEQQ